MSGYLPQAWKAFFQFATEINLYKKKNTNNLNGEPVRQTNSVVDFKHSAALSVIITLAGDYFNITPFRFTNVYICSLQTHFFHIRKSQTVQAHEQFRYDFTYVKDWNFNLRYTTMAESEHVCHWRKGL